jgi:hypothetical protein
MGQIRNLLVLALLASCDKAPSCGYFDPAIKLASSAVAKELGCNEAKVNHSITSALVKVKVCSENVAFQAMDGKGALCIFVPIIATAIGDEATRTWECKKTGVKLSDLLNKVMKCQ